MAERILATWKVGMESLYKGADAQKCAEEILEIGEEATPEQIVEKAKNEQAELHKCFEWDDQKAAAKYRIGQAVKLTANLVFVRMEEQIEKQEPEIRVFHKPTGSSGYKPLNIIIQNKDEYQELLKRAYAELHAFKVKYASLQELDYILSLIP